MNQDGDFVPCSMLYDAIFVSWSCWLLVYDIYRYLICSDTLKSFTFECCCLLARCCVAMCAVPEEVTREELTKSLGGRELIMEDLEFRH